MIWLPQRRSIRYGVGMMRWLIVAMALWACGGSERTYGAAMDHGAMEAFPPALTSYGDANAPGLISRLQGRVMAEPLNAVATLLFFCAILHTFAASFFVRAAHRAEEQHAAWLERAHPSPQERARAAGRLHVKTTLLHFLGEVEAVFGIWAVPLAGVIVAAKGWETFARFAEGVHFAEPIFVFVIMTIAGSRPILRVAEGLLAGVAGQLGAGPLAWWVSILTLGPLLASLITEPGAMTICALLLARKFYDCSPGLKLRYATLGLLFVNVSVGGVLTHFAAPPVLMVAGRWGWDTPFMLTHFGWKAVVGIAASNAVYFAWFRSELAALRACVTEAEAREERLPLPVWVVGVHMLFMGWTVFVAHHPALTMAGLLFYLAFVEATRPHQDGVTLRGPLMVGFFLAGLVFHGGLQQWWIAPVLGGLSEWPLFVGATFLTSFNDNAAITYLASLVPGLSDSLKYAVVAGAVTGGGLTVIANAPNPAGQSILKCHFPEGVVSPLGLAAAALVPTLLVGAALMLL